MHIHISTGDGVPIYLQIVQQVKLLVASGRLAPGEELPPIRVLADQILVNPNTVAKAYRELEREGTVATRPGDGVFVADGAALRCATLCDRRVKARLTREVLAALAAGIGPQEIEEIVARALARERAEVTS